LTSASSAATSERETEGGLLAEPLDATVLAFELDFSEATTMNGVWDEVNLKLGFDGFGRNLDALTDVLRGGFGHFQPWEEIRLVVRGRPGARERVGPGWAEVEATLAEAPAQEYGEMVSSIEWADADSQDEGGAAAKTPAAKTTAATELGTTPSVCGTLEGLLDVGRLVVLADILTERKSYSVPNGASVDLDKAWWVSGGDAADTASTPAAVEVGEVEVIATSDSRELLPSDLRPVHSPSHRLGESRAMLLVAVHLCAPSVAQAS
jgi:hypothetical protein